MDITNKNDNACIVDWNTLEGTVNIPDKRNLEIAIKNKIETNTGPFSTSLTNLDGIEGAVPNNTNEGSAYGSNFMETNLNTPYYEKIITERVEVPWLGQYSDQSFMTNSHPSHSHHNNTHQEFEVSNIQENENHNNHNHNNNHNNNQNNQIENKLFNGDYNHLIFKILCVIFLIMMICYLIKQIN